MNPVPTSLGRALVGLDFFTSADCSGPRSDGITSVPASAGDGAWQTIRTNRRSPSDAHSMAVRLLVQKPYAQDPLTVRFDNVLVRKP
jgi:hypothetical protein